MCSTRNNFTDLRRMKNDLLKALVNSMSLVLFSLSENTMQDRYVPRGKF